MSSELLLSRAVRAAREQRGMSVAGLAERSEVSRAMINKIERGDAQPTAQLLARIAAGCDMTLSRLIEAAESGGRRVSRREEQTIWTDPATGYTRRALSPSTSDELELVEIELPAGAVVGYAPGSYPAVQQQIWMLEGELEITEDDGTIRLAAGDCLRFVAPGARRYRNPGARSCRYLLALVAR